MATGGGDSKRQTFADLGLESRLFKAVAKLGHVYPTIIQVRGGQRTHAHWSTHVEF
jgi:superfamily II DNA/RNA helicase